MSPCRQRRGTVASSDHQRYVPSFDSGIHQLQAQPLLAFWMQRENVKDTGKGNRCCIMPRKDKRPTKISSMGTNTGTWARSVTPSVRLTRRRIICLSYQRLCSAELRQVCHRPPQSKDKLHSLRTLIMSRPVLPHAPLFSDCVTASTLR